MNMSTTNYLSPSFNYAELAYSERSLRYFLPSNAVTSHLFKEPESEPVPHFNFDCVNLSFAELSLCLWPCLGLHLGMLLAL